MYFLAEISEMCFVRALGLGWPRSSNLQVLGFSTLFSQTLIARQPCDCVTLQCSCVHTGAPISLFSFSFCCVCACSCEHLKDNLDSAVSSRAIPSCFMCDLCAGASMYIHAHVSTCMWRLEINSEYLPQSVSTSFFETRSSENLGFADSATACKPQGSSSP